MKILNIVFIGMLFFAVSIHHANANDAPSWGAAQSFAVLGSATITSTGPTVVYGNVGVSPGSAVTGFPPATIVGGAIYSGAASLAGPAEASALAAFNAITLQTGPAGNNLTGLVLGQTAGAVALKPGVYTFSSSAQLNATLTLDDGGDPNAVFIFKIGSTLTTASYSKVVMSSGGKGTNVFWQIGSSATIGTYTSFVGNIIAMASITMTTGATTTGRLFALNGATTMDSNNIAAIPQIIDEDADGVADIFDDYPKDASKAFNNNDETGTTVAFEDQWPKKGDFDMNDLVMIQKYNVVTNAQNVVVQVIGHYTLTATGGTFGSAFGIEFPIPRGNITGLTGGTLEEGQTNAVVMLFSDMRSETNIWNTLPGVLAAAPKTYTISFNVINGPKLGVFGTDYNPFIMNTVGASRREVHLVGKPPTTLADKAVFGTGDDNTAVAAGRFYLTTTGLPYAITVPANFSYPIEGADITLAYLHFADWANSGGVTYTDWYSNLTDGYRNPALIFIK